MCVFVVRMCVCTSLRYVMWAVCSRVCGVHACVCMRVYRLVCMCGVRNQCVYSRCVYVRYACVMRV